MAENRTELRESRDRHMDSLPKARLAVQAAKQRGEPVFNQYRGLYRKWWYIGNYSLLLNEVERAREEFATAALYMRPLIDSFISENDEIEWRDKTGADQDFYWGLYLAILSGDSRIVDAAVDSLHSLDDDFEAVYGISDEWYLKIRPVLSICRRGDDDARVYLAELESTDHTVLGDLLISVQESILSGDETATRDSLNALANGHPDYFDESSSWKVQFSHATVAHMLVARDRGMDITAAALDSEYVPVAFDEYDIGDTIDLPDPEHVDEDFIPG